MNDIQNNISTQSTTASSPAHHQTNGISSTITDSPDSLLSQPAAPPPPAPPSTQKRRIYCLSTRRTYPPSHPLFPVLTPENRPSKPSASQDLIALYNLTPLANAVARFDPLTRKKNTMRKSYQGHIKDLPGKNMIRPDNVIREIIRVPESEADTFVGPRNIRRLEKDVLEGFGVMPGMIPDVFSFPFILCKVLLFTMHMRCLLSHSLDAHSISFIYMFLKISFGQGYLLTIVRPFITRPRRRPKRVRSPPITPSRPRRLRYIPLPSSKKGKNVVLKRP